MFTKCRVVMCSSICHNMMGQFKQRQMSHQNRVNLGQLFTQTCTNQTSWIVHGWSTFGAWTNHRYTRIHKIHHDPNLKEGTTFLTTLLKILSFATNHYAIDMQLNIVYNYFGHVCNYKLVFYNFSTIQLCVQLTCN
jgi:hypothetical protein